MRAYAWGHASGYPIGRGRGESTNKRVVARRRQGAGRHGALADQPAGAAMRDGVRRSVADSLAAAGPAGTRTGRARPMVAPAGQRIKGLGPVDSPAIPSASASSLVSDSRSGSAAHTAALAAGPTGRWPWLQRSLAPAPDHPRRHSRMGQIRSQLQVAACVAKLCPAPRSVTPIPFVCLCSWVYSPLKGRSHAQEICRAVE
jgi:hypothetical protein